MNSTGFALVLAFALVGCSGASDAPSDGPALDPGPGTFAQDYATSGAFFTRMTEPRKGLSSSPHGVVQIFYSNNFRPAVGSDRFEASPGTVAIKAQDQNNDGQIDTIQVMIKKDKGYDDLTHDWLFERYFANGTLDVSGGSTLNFCHECHNGFAQTSELAGTMLSN
jgi:hypothetical protein